jgi:hypothetical protein
MQLLKRVRHDDPNVQHVCIENRRLPAKYVVALLHAVSESNFVTQLQLRRVYADDSTAKAVAKCLRNNLSLTTIDLGKNKFSDTGCQQIASALRATGADSRLRRLNLEQNKIGDKGIDQLCRAVRAVPSLTILKLGKNNFGLQGLRSIALLLRNSPTCCLKSLDLRSNNVGNEGATILADALSENRTLLYLYLNCNHLDNRGVARLAAALKHNQHLRTLDLQRNQFDDIGANAFVKTLANDNDSFVKLKIRHTAVSEEIKSELLDLLLMNSHGPDLARRTKLAMMRLRLLRQQQQQEVDDSSSSSSSGDFGDNIDGDNLLSDCRSSRLEEQELSECVICFDNISDCALLLPCQHCNCCLACSTKLKGCHMCRSEIVKVVPLHPAARTLFRAYC